MKLNVKWISKSKQFVHTNKRKSEIINVGLFKCNDDTCTRNLDHCSDWCLTNARLSKADSECTCLDLGDCVHSIRDRTAKCRAVIIRMDFSIPICSVVHCGRYQTHTQNRHLLLSFFFLLLSRLVNIVVRRRRRRRRSD